MPSGPAAATRLLAYGLHLGNAAGWTLCLALIAAVGCLACASTYRRARAIADIATWPWVNNLVAFYGAGELVGWSDFTEVQRVLAAFVQRPAVARGLLIPARD